MAFLHVWLHGTNDVGNRFPTKQGGASTIQAAVDIAVPGDRIVVYGDANPGPRCTYTENVVINDSHGTIKDPLVFIGMDWPIVDGSGKGAVFKVTEDAGVTMSEFEIVNGRGPGGGVFATDARLEMYKCCVHNNVGLTGGGGVYFVLDDENLPSLVIQNCSFHNNEGNQLQWTLRGGGAIGVVASDSDGGGSTLIKDNVIGPQNFAYGFGGGIFIETGEEHPATIEGNYIYGNYLINAPGATRGGGIYIRGRSRQWPGPFDDATALPHLYGMIAKGARVKVRNNIIAKNQARDGAGIAAEWGATLLVSGNTIRLNQASDDGGGIYATVSAEVTLTEPANFIHHNVAASNGGGIHCTCGATIVTRGSHCVEKNIAVTGNGGGLSFRTGHLVSKGGLEVRANCANIGGGIFSHTGDDSAKDANWIFCEEDPGLEVRDALVQGNVARQRGGGIAILKEESNTPRRTVLLANSTIRANEAADGTDGILIEVQVGQTLRFTPSIAGCRIENHTHNAGSTGVTLVDLAPPSLAPRIRDSLFRANVNGVRNTKSSLRISRSRFEEDVATDVAIINGAVGLKENHFVGGAAFGVSVTGAGDGVTGNGNTFLTHSLFGVSNSDSTHPVTLTNCWWGHLAGPTVPGGPVAGDKIRGLVAFVPVAGGAIASATLSPAVPNHTSTTFVDPRPQILSVLSEFFHGLGCVELDGEERVTIPPLPGH